MAKNKFWDINNVIVTLKAIVVSAATFGIGIVFLTAAELSNLRIIGVFWFVASFLVWGWLANKWWGWK